MNETIEKMFLIIKEENQKICTAEAKRETAIEVLLQNNHFNDYAELNAVYRGWEEKKADI